MIASTIPAMTADGFALNLKLFKGGLVAKADLIKKVANRQS